MIAKRNASIEWWKKAMDEVGIECMDKTIRVQASWAEILRTGQSDLDRAISITGMACGKDRTVIEVGCGVGRVTAALAQHFGCVIGIDVADKFIDEARRMNSNSHVTFEVSDGSRICPATVRKCDTIFSYEVFYYVDPDLLLTYFRDAYELLDSNGQFVFHLNMEPIQLKTRASYLWRQSLYICGIQKWRGWPTGPGLRRFCHSHNWINQHLSEVGFQVEKITGPSLRQQWVVALKP
jgi:cyclopropane fatty-acyl-phospholipid synthase-like methyltransferase